MEKQVEVVAALIWQEDRFLICQRPAQKARHCNGNLWAARWSRGRQSSRH